MRHIGPAIFALALFAAGPSCGPPSTRIDPATLERLDRIANGPEDWQNGWPLYRQALDQLADPPEGTDYARDNVPGSPRWKNLARWLDDNRAILPLLEAAAERDHYGMSYRPRSATISTIEIVSLGDNRHFINLLCTAAREAEAQGDLDQAIRHVCTASRIAMQISARPLFIEQAIGAGLLAIAASEHKRLAVAQAEKWSPGQIDALTASPLMKFRPLPVAAVLQAQSLLGPVSRFDRKFHSDMQYGLRQQDRKLRAVMAMVQYRHSQGQYPSSLADLDVPDENWRGFRYCPPVEGRDPVLYSFVGRGKDPLQSHDVVDPAEVIARLGDENLLIPGQ